MKFYEYHDKLDFFLHSLIEDEISCSVESTDGSGVMLRSNTVGVKFISMYIRRVGGEYLNELVGPWCEQVTKLKTLEQGIVMNQENGKVSKFFLEKGDVEMVKEVTGVFLERVCNSVERCPFEMRKVLKMLSSEIERNKYPEMRLTCITSLLFLRCICPAILIPGNGNNNNNGNENTVVRGEGIQKWFVIISKLLQNLANGVEFDGSKESYMIPLNGFITGGNNKQKLSEFMDELINVKEDMRPKINGVGGGSGVSKKELRVSMKVIRDCILHNIDNIWEIGAKNKNTGKALRRFWSVGMCSVLLH